ncbi:MAG: homocysteine S-methyltransferase family protein [Lachnospiraceae bacterium]|nr:homocysteine S-methyltransferase family protein [Lachnospiraceae bacterium]
MPERTDIIKKIHDGLVFFDGGCGTLLQEMGLGPGELPERWNITHPERLIGIHYDYLMAGANIISANTFGANSLKFSMGADRPEDDLKLIIEAAVKNARTAIERAHAAKIADGSLSGDEPFDAWVALDVGPTGKLLQPLGDLAYDRAIDIFAEVMKIGAACGVDLILIETMNDSHEAKAAVLAAKENANVPVFVTTVYDEGAKLLTGANPQAMVALLEGLGVDALGMNCSLGPEQMKHIVPMLTEVASVPVIVNPNAGLPRTEHGKTVYDVTPEQFAAAMVDIMHSGARILGGCCGTTPAHIQAMIRAVRAAEAKTPIPPLTEKNITMVSSYTHAVILNRATATVPGSKIPGKSNMSDLAGSEGESVFSDTSGHDGKSNSSTLSGHGGESVFSDTSGHDGESNFSPLSGHGRESVSSDTFGHDGESNFSPLSGYGSETSTPCRPVLIGERINPTGKKRFKQALRDHDIDYILQEGLAEQELGADILDVNVGLPEIDEPQMMEEVVAALQGVLDLPLQIDTTDIQAMERALRLYNGKAMINSVNGKTEVMKAIFPLAKKYGGLIVALTLDEDGIPDTAAGRIAIAERIYATAAEYSIKRKDIIIDPLCMTVSTDDRSALTTLEAVRGIHEMGGLTSLGVSNISFGLPNREDINSTFFTMALENGLNAAIMNPHSAKMQSAFYAFCALHGLDAQCRNYMEYVQEMLPKIQAEKSAGVGGKTAGGAGSAGTAGGGGSAFGAGVPGSSGSAGGKSAHGTGSAGSEGLAGAVSGTGSAGAASGESSVDLSHPLIRAITKGLKDQAAKITGELLDRESSLQIIDGYLIPALDVVGKGFEAKTVFLPQLLMSAEAATAAFEVIKKRLAASGVSEAKKGIVVLATVKGDIHDIGKNIVKVLLENYGFEVIDLGKDVPPETVVKAVQDSHAPVAGLSALMTTTVPAMEETIKQLRAGAPWCKVVVGGAVLTQEYADMIGADKYAKDAMETVRYAEFVTAS